MRGFSLMSSLQSRPREVPLVPSPLNQLPDELLEGILEQCAQGDLLQLSRTNWRFYRLGSRFLYRHVKPTSPDKLLIFFITICTQKEFAPLVRSLEIDHSLSKVMIQSPLKESDFGRRLRKLGNRQAYQHRHILRNALTLAKAALKELVNLNSLDLIMPDGESHQEYYQLLEDMPFILDAFHTTVKFDHHIIEFLNNQPDIKDFHFYSSVPFSNLDLTTLPRTTLPSLTSLSWSNRIPMDLIRFLISGRPVSKITVNLYPGKADFSESLGIGPAAARRVTNANLAYRDRSRPTASQLKVLATHYPNLVGLALAMTLTREDISRDLASSINQFKRLERLFVYDHNRREKATANNLKTLAAILFKKSSSLKKAVLYTANPGLIADKVLCNESGSKDSEPKYTIRLRQG